MTLRASRLDFILCSSALMTKPQDEWMHAYKRDAYEMHAYEWMHAYEMHACKMHAHVRDARLQGTCPCVRRTPIRYMSICEMHAHVIRCLPIR